MPMTESTLGECDRQQRARDRREILAGRRLILASNRGPITYSLVDDELRANRGAGGVVTALASLCRYTDVTWVSAAMSDADREADRQPNPPRPASFPPSLDHRFVVVREGAFDRHYNVLSNPILWFVHHYLWNAAYGPLIDDRVRDAWQNGYVVVNRAFAETLAPLASPKYGEETPFVLLQDYQMYLVPHFLRERCPSAIVSHFVHIPWPAPSYWQLLPSDMREPIFQSLCQVDVVGFQTPHFARNFLNTCEDFVDGAEVDYRENVVRYRGRSVRVRVYPISVDVEQLRRLASSTSCARYYERLTPPPGVRTIVRVDRLDPSKNVLRGFESYRLLLERRPDLRGTVRFLAFLVPSRTSIAEYRRYRERVFALVDEINDRFGTADWKPIEVFYENNVVQAVAGMRLADVLLVNPVLDGMNLVAKEGAIVNERDAPLILSEGAGAWFQLGDYVLSVSPGDVAGTADALERSLKMSPAERVLRSRALRRAIEAEDLNWWVDTQLRDLDQIAQERDGAQTVVCR